MKIGALFLPLLLHFCASSQDSACALPPTQNIYWNTLTGNNGLSQNSVTSIMQDAKGFIWIGTYDGLNRFDGFTTQVKRHESNNDNSLSDNRILCLYENKLGNILIGTDGGGLNIFDPARDNFRHISLVNGNTNYNTILSICTDKQGNSWIGTSNGLCIIRDSTQAGGQPSIRFPNGFENTLISKVICDKAGNVWIGSDKGLFIVKATGIGDKQLPPAAFVQSLGRSLITALFQDNQHNIWVARNGGLFTAGFIGDNPANELIVKDRYQQLMMPDKYPADISDICTDLSGNLLVSTRDQGLFKFAPGKGGNLTRAGVYNTSQPFCNISEDRIKVVFTDRSNTVWVGTYRKGVNYFNFSNKNFYSFNKLLATQKGEFGYKGKFITAVTANSDGLWIGTDDEGLFGYNLCNGKLTGLANTLNTKNIICLYPQKENLWVGTDAGLYQLVGGRKTQLILAGTAIRSICVDHFGRLWLASWAGIVVYDPATKTSRSITVRNGLSANTCFTLYADPLENTIWAGTIGGGLNRISYDEGKENTFLKYQHDPKDKNSLSNNHVWCVYRDKQQVLWIGTDAGLDRCILNGKQGVSVFKPVLHLPLKDRKITSILEDEANNLWLSSSQGLFRYNTGNEDIRQYTYRDGLQSNSFTEAAYKDASGRMYFGGINGLNYFDPSNININPFLPSTAIVDFKIFNRSIMPGENIDGKAILAMDINNTGKISLSHRQNNFLLSFAALHYAVPDDNRFRYKLEGYDKDWVITGHDHRFAAYSNLDAGEYIFKLVASNNDNIWGKEIKTLHIVVQPAPWSTWWAKVVYALAAAALAWLVFRHFKDRQQFKTELYLEKIEKEKVTELNEIKLNFFTGITHELRTPLNLITGPVQELINRPASNDPFTQFRLNIIQRNALRLLELINQVLDLRKISGSAQRLSVAPYDLVKTVGEIKKSFDWLAKQKSIHFNFDYPEPAGVSWFDHDKVHKITTNLLSNAFKHTPASGTISVSLQIEYPDNHLASATIRVMDSGHGIPVSDQANIFELFYQGSQPDNTGTGIGLALSKKLAELHHGSLTFEQDQKTGATFIFSFPLSRHAYLPDDFFVNIGTNPPREDEAGHTAASMDDPLRTRDTGKRKTLLVVEDNEDQFAYIKDCLGNDFEILGASNGTLGFETAVRLRPDLIITDIMMPGLNGVDLSKKLKNDIRTQHIPVIIHSVKNNDDTLRQVYESGADDIVAKPFDYQLLRLKVANILQSRISLLTNNYKEQLVNPIPVAVPSHQEDLLKSILQLVEEHMSDPDFSVERLAKLLSMSRMNLHRKLFSFTGKTASEVIREIRIKKAAQLLATGSKRVTEVMYEVGISSNFHFNKYFKEMYNVSPKDFLKKQQ